MNIASCGLGTNSIAGIIHAVLHGIVFDEILFSNTGRGRKFGERAATYDYIKIFNGWLCLQGHKEIKIVFVFGFKTCSQRFKTQPANKFLNNNPQAKNEWALGNKITKWIFYDAGEPQRAKDYEDKKYKVRYYLIENNFDREDCERIITEANLPLPAKSSCFYCPSMKPNEIIDLYITEPSKFYEAVDLERNAASTLTSIKGLGREFSWWDLIVAYRYLQFIERNPISGVVVDMAVKKLMMKIKRSQKKKLSKKQSPKETACSLFDVYVDLPCGCFDG